MEVHPLGRERRIDLLENQGQYIQNKDYARYEKLTGTAHKTR